MNKYHWIWALILVLVVGSGCSKTADQVTDAATEDQRSELEIAYDEAADAYRNTEDPEKKVAIAKEFLARFPDSDKTDNMLARALYPLVEDLDRPEEAYALFDEIMPRISDPDDKLDGQIQLAVLYSKTGHSEELGELVRSMVEEHEFDYSTYYDVIDSAIEAEAWELAIEQAEASLQLATAEAYKVQYGDEISDEDAVKFGARRLAYSNAFKGWALQNLGRHEEALEVFGANVDNTTYSLIGTDDTPLHQYWGQSLVLQGKPEEALEVLEIETLYGSDESKQAYKEAWIAASGSEEGLEEHLWNLRQEHATPLPQFALANYDGETVDTADFAGDVMLVAAWFPT